MASVKELGTNIKPSSGSDDPELVAARPSSVKRTRIMLEDSEAVSPGGQFISVNGATYLLQPGVEVDVPDALLGVLNDAVENAPVIDPQTRKLIGHRLRQRFPYRVINRVA